MVASIDDYEEDTCDIAFSIYNLAFKNATLEGKRVILKAFRLLSKLYSLNTICKRSQLSYLINYNAINNTFSISIKNPEQYSTPEVDSLLICLEIAIKYFEG